MNLAHIGITTADINKAVDWYKENFGFNEVRRFEKKELEISACLITNGEINIELIMPNTVLNTDNKPHDLTEALRDRGLNHIAVNVDDIKAFYGNLKANGVSLLTELIDNRLFFAFDLDGTKIEIRQK